MQGYDGEYCTAHRIEELVYWSQNYTRVGHNHKHVCTPSDIRTFDIDRSMMMCLMINIFFN